MNRLPVKIELPEGFLEEEIRYGYTVSKDMKAVWAVELDLLAEFQRVCDKYNIEYFADGGTMLGAVRHNGYIPWDDDIDVMMMRDQYEILCDVADDEFKFPYFFQTEYSDPTSLRGHAQLRNSVTTGILEADREGIRPFNQGIFIDIFPIDAVPEDEEALNIKITKIEKYLTRARRFANITDRYTPTPNTRPIKKIVKRVAHLVFSGPLKNTLDYDKWYEKYEEECKLYNEEKTLKVAKFFCIPFCRGQIWYREDFSDSIRMPFEMMEINVPIGYKRIMDIFFGDDWETPKMIPTVHSEVLFDPYNSYNDYTFF